MQLPTNKEECDVLDCDCCVYNDHWGLIQCQQRDEFNED